MSKQFQSTNTDEPNSKTPGEKSSPQNAGSHNEQTASADQASSPPRNEKKTYYQAIARVKGAIVAEGKHLFVTTDSDGVQFPVSGIKPNKLPMKLVALLPEERKGFIGFWPRADGSIVIASFSTPDDYVPNAFSPQTDEMLLSGKLKSCHSDRFIVSVKRNRGARKSKSIDITVSSTPPESLQSGQWVDLRLQRSGRQWVLPDGYAPEE